MPGNTKALPRPSLEFRFAGSRLYQVLYWRIDPNGKGEVSTPTAGYPTVAAPDSNEQYFIAAGLHRFDIGRKGYDELRKLFGDVLNDKVDQYGLTETSTDTGALSLCIQGRTLDLPSRQLQWRGATKGMFMMPSACLNAEGKVWAERFDQSWAVIARAMIRTGQGSARVDRLVPVTVPAPLPPPIPLTLDYRQRSPRTGWEVHWHLVPDGTGWLDLSEGANMTMGNPAASGPTTLYVAKGRHDFDIGPAGYTEIRTALEPYISGPERTAQCDGISDQPLVTLTVENAARAIRGETRTDLGCRDFAQRAGLAERIILSALAKRQP